VHPDEIMRQGIDAFYSKDSGLLAASAESLRLLNVSPWAQNRLDGLLLCHHHHFAEGAIKLLASFDERSEPQVMHELVATLTLFEEPITLELLQEVLLKAIETTRQCRNLKFNPEWVVRLEWAIGFLLYTLDAPVQIPKMFAAKWREGLPGDHYANADCKLLVDLDYVEGKGCKRFFPFLLTLADMHEDVLRANTMMTRVPDELNLPQEVDVSPDEYASNPIYRRTAYNFIARIPEEKMFAKGLDLGCGAGIMGEILGERIEHLTGVDMNRKSLDHASSGAGYDDVIEADVIEFLNSNSGEYDLIIACMLLDYVPGKEVIRLAAERLAIDGLLVFSFIPSLEATPDNDVGRHRYYLPDFFAAEAPALSVVSCEMNTYMWTGGYYVVMKRPGDCSTAPE